MIFDRIFTPNDHIQQKNKSNGNVWELSTEGQNCDKHNIIEQVTDFKYLGYRISEYKSDLEDKLQKYNKINGAIRRHFGKQTNKETKLRIHNITAKVALKFGGEDWVLRKREEQHLEAAQMKFLRHLLGIIKLDKEKNQCIREKREHRT